MPKLKIIRFVTIFAAGLCLFSALPAYAARTVNISADDMYAFAMKCYTTGDYPSAVVEFKRFVFYFPDDPRSPKAYFSIAMAYFKNQRYGAAESAFQSTVEKYPKKHVAIESVFMISRCYLKLGDTTSAIQALQNLAARTGRKQIRDRAWDRLGWIYLETGNIDQARLYFEKISASGRIAYHQKEILAVLDRPRKQLPYKSPVIAGVLSIIPGGGYLYCGRYQDALISFLLTSSLGMAAYESFDKDLYALGGVISIVNLGFYGGNIYGGITSAYKYNQRAYDGFVDQLREQTRRNDEEGERSGLTLGIRHRGIFLSFNYRF